MFSLYNDIKFKIKIIDIGILNLDNPYFYIFLVDPDNLIRACFPNCKYDSRKEYLDFWSMTSSPKSLISVGSYSLKNEIFPLIKDKSLFMINREDLIAGKGVYRYEVSSEESGAKYLTSEDIVDYHYTYPLDKVGDWEIYLLVFGEEYLKRDGNLLYHKRDRDDNNNIVNYAKNIINVKGLEELPVKEYSIWPLILKILASFIGAILTYFTIYVTLNKYYDNISKFIKGLFKEKQYWIGLIIILIAFIIFLFSLKKW